MADLFAVDAPDTAVETITIANGATDSSVAHMKGYRLVGIEYDSAIDGSTMTWKAGTRSGTLQQLQKNDGSDGTLTTVTTGVAASKFVAVDPVDFAGCVYLQAIASSQTGATTIRLVCQRL